MGRLTRHAAELEAIESTGSGAVAEGCVGAGTGTGPLWFKAGIGTSSRLLELDDVVVTIGALVQANFGGTLRVRDVPFRRPVGLPATTARA